MKTRCPCCGAENSLDALVSHEEAREAMLAVMNIGGEMAKLAVQYLGLFRPQQTTLTWSRMAKLLNELLPDIQRGAINRDRVEYPAPAEAWIYGLREVLVRRQTLKLPLKSHGYLYEIISAWQGQGLAQMPSEQMPPENQASQTLNAAMQLQGLRR